MKFDIEQYGKVCSDALEYYKTKDSFEEAWNDCHRGDWMLWIAAQMNIDRWTLFLAKARCAKTVYHLMEDGRSRHAVDMAEKYGLNQCSLEELKVAHASAASAAVAASYAASYAAVVAAAASAAVAAASAAVAAAASSSAAYKNQRETANICREILTDEVFKIVSE